MVDETDLVGEAKLVESKDELDNDQTADTVFSLRVNLPHEPYRIQIMVALVPRCYFRAQSLNVPQVSHQEQMQDVRQSIVEFPGTFQYSCFHLEHNGERINDYIELSEVNGLSSGSEITLVEDPYTEKEARLHVVRIRELIGAAGDRTDMLHGISAGLSLHDVVAAPQHKAASNGQPTTGETADAHAMSNYDFESPGSFSTLLPPVQPPPPKTIKSISLSPWNPPPHYLRQKGHLIYLQVTTNEGEQHQITSHVTGFYVNKSTNSRFDPFPKPAPKTHAAHSLLSVISSLSPLFVSSFPQLLEYNNQKDPMATFQLTNTIPSNPWLVAPSTSPLHTHHSDITRTQENYLMSGQEHVELLRDWNEEFQSTRELPRETVQERLFRDRLTSKLFADYNECAARGALLVARGEVAPLNPTESRDAQIFLYNNVFFSYGADGVGTFAAEGGDEAARVATGKDVKGVKAVNDLDIPGLFTPGTVVVDYLGKRLVGQSIVPGIFKQRDPGENQIDYGGVEGRDVVAEHEGFVPVFEKLSKSARVKRHPVWDKEGKRHDLEGSVETKGLLGTDGRKYVLDLYRITPLDVNWLEECWVGKADVVEASANKSHHGPYPHRMAVLRPELVEAFWKVKLKNWVNEELDRRRQAKKAKGELETGGTPTNESDAEIAETKTNGAKADKTDEKMATNHNSEKPELEQERIDVSNFYFALNPDVFAGQVPQTDGEKAEWAQDEKDVGEVCDYLRSTIIPEFIHDLDEGDLGYPMDGESLSRLMHKRGINIRYLGKIAALARAQGRRVESVNILAIQEMISRGFKHVANRYLRYLPAPFAAECIAHLLNCLLGTGLNANPVVEIDDTLRSIYPEADLGFEKVTPESLKHEVELQVRRRYRYDLDEEWVPKIRHVQLLREIALKMGLQLEAKEYYFLDKPATPVDPEGTIVNGVAKSAVANGNPTTTKKKKRSGSPTSSIGSGSSKPPVTFTAEDIMNIVPVIKDSTPKSALAEEALEGGRISIMQNQKEVGQELLLESLSLHEQIYGILHPEVSRVYNQLSLLYYQLEEKSAAVELARKAVIVSERTIGIDSAETVLNYLNLGLFEHANGNTKSALAYIKHALELWKIIYGPGHPDSITTINNAAVMLQHIKEFHESRLWFEASLVVCEKTYDRQSIHTATLLFQLAQALALDNDSKGAVNRMRECYNIFLNELGAKDRNTKEAETWLEQLTQNAVSIAKHAKDVQARKLRRINLTPHVTLAMRPQPQVGQSSADAANGTSGSDPRSSIGLDSRSIDELMKFIEGSDASKTTPKKRPGRNNPKRRGGGSIGGS
ncbi:MAG: Intracellular distribution of mitochondria [Geoglossum umbratile]|nr:MAG: Intracellular distribution of mitochondria [Geoglossum umbratile]